MNHDIFLAEYESVKTGKLSINCSARAKWVFSGPDATRYLNGQVTNDVRNIQPGKALYSALTNAKGKMEADIWIHSRENALRVDADSSLKEALTQRFEKYLVADQVEIKEATNEWRLYHRIGTDRLLRLKMGCWAVKCQRFGEMGWDIWEPISGEERASACAEVVEIIRIENGMPKWGREMTEKTLPPEVGLDKWAVSYTKGCYIGQEVLARIKSIGHVNWQLCKLVGEGDQVPACPEAVLVNEKDAGTITSAAWSLAQKKVIALALLHRQYAAIGAQVISASNTWRII